MLFDIPSKPQQIRWPNGKKFAFTAFDDTDSATVDNVREVYAFLADQGLRTTKTVWPLKGSGVSTNGGSTCQDPEYRAWLEQLNQQGFEIALHNSTYHTSDRAATRQGLEIFRDIFGYYPRSMANHTSCEESIYWGDGRVTGAHRVLYNALTRGRERNKYFGNASDHSLFWGDLCKSHIKFVRNFTYPGVNTLRACPDLPYHDPDRPYVNYWFAASEGAGVESFTRTLTEAQQDQLEEEGGLCLMYTHFAFRFQDGNRIQPRFRKLIERIARKDGWFASTSDILEHILAARGHSVIDPARRRLLERRWLLHKIKSGST